MPISPYVILMIIPLLPSWCFLNRGYTVWFHWNCLFFLLTQNEFLSKFCAIQGTTLSMGWYGTIVYDWYRHGRVGDILYWNMPTGMAQYMLDMSTIDINQRLQLQQGVVVYNHLSVFVMLLSHILDIIGHPLMAYYFWRRQWRKDQQEKQQQQQHQHQQPQKEREGEGEEEEEEEDGNNHHKNNSNVSENTVTITKPNKNNRNDDGMDYTVCTWPVLVSTFLLSRFWSALHMYYNQGKVGCFYVGYDIYVILDKEASLSGFWYPAYIMEVFSFLALVGYKLFNNSHEKKTATASLSSKSRLFLEKEDFTTVPSLMRSSTSISDSGR